MLGYMEKDAVRAYWTRQWPKIHTHDEPCEITDHSEDSSVVRISQVVRALNGSILSKGLFDHVYRFEVG